MLFRCSWCFSSLFSPLKLKIVLWQDSEVLKRLRWFQRWKTPNPTNLLFLTQFPHTLRLSTSAGLSVCHHNNRVDSHSERSSIVPEENQTIRPPIRTEPERTEHWRRLIQLWWTLNHLFIRSHFNNASVSAAGSTPFLQVDGRGWSMSGQPRRGPVGWV